MNNHHSFQSLLEGENAILFANSGKAAKEQAEQPLGNFLKSSHRPTMTEFHKITNSAKSVILTIIHNYAKVSRQ